MAAKDPDLVRALRSYIEQSGPISLATFMALALNHPKHGYYTTRDPLGRRGDFITAPEISPLFGDALSVWCVLVWEAMDKPKPVRLVELGPGRGTLMADILRRVAQAAPEFSKAADVHLIETGATLREKQQAALAGLPVSWHGSVTGVPDGPMVLLANEFFDAMPIVQFIRAEDGWRERCVDWHAGEQRFVFRADKKLPGRVPAALEGAPLGAIYEASPVAEALAEAIGQRLSRQGGGALVIDYGRDATAAGDSLVALRAHRIEADPLVAPGEADLSAYVDFEALGASFRRGGSACYGPIAQADLLRALGIEARRDALLQHATKDQAEALKAGCARLIDPQSMGQTFRAMAAISPTLPPPPGFAPAGAAS